MKNILFVAHLQSHIVNFHMPYINYFVEKGYVVYIATKLNYERYSFLKDNDYIKWIDVDIPRKPYSFKLIKALNELTSLMRKVKFDLIHVHTPVGGFLGRLAAQITKSGPVLYTAHGFHFYKGAPLSHWLIYYPVEKISARWTDGLITINNEDYEKAKNNLKVREGNIFKVNGVGVSFDNHTLSKDIREELGIGKNDFVISMIGELNKNKNQIQLIRSLPKVIEKHGDIKVLFAGEGNEIENLKNESIKLNIDKNIEFLGWRDDIYDIIEASNVVCSFSKREGLPKNIMESMLLGKVVIATNVRGNCDLINHDFNGYLVEVDDVENTTKYLTKLIENDQDMKRFSENTLNKIERYKLENVIKDMDNIYMKYLNG